jgi:RimJ/RimL family protein N-acetyltransferase
MTLRAEPLTPFPVEKFSALVEKLCQHDPWFWDGIRDDPQARRQAVIAYLADAHNFGKCWEVWRDDEVIGVLVLNEMTPFLSARAHFVFTDSALSDKKDLCLALMKQAFESIPLEVIRVELPAYAKALLKFIRKLGFKWESEDREFSWPADAAPLTEQLAKLGSRKHHGTLYRGTWHDILLLSVTRAEFQAHLDTLQRQPSKPSAKTGRNGAPQALEHSVGSRSERQNT